MVKSAYYSQLPSVRCRDCGQMIEIGLEHHCYATPRRLKAQDPYPTEDEQLQRVRNPKPYQQQDNYYQQQASPQPRYDYQDQRSDPYGQQQPPNSGYDYSYNQESYYDPTAYDPISPSDGPNGQQYGRGNGYDSPQPDRYGNSPQPDRYGNTPYYGEPDDRGRSDPQRKNTAGSVRSGRSGRDRSQPRDKSRTRDPHYEREQHRRERDQPAAHDLRTNGLDAVRGDSAYNSAGSSANSGRPIDAVMADLMSEMQISGNVDRQVANVTRNGSTNSSGSSTVGAPKKKRPPCAECGHRITDPKQAFRIEALRKFYHINCFRCCKCSRPFDENNPYICHEGRAYCEADYNEALNLSCAGCQMPIYSHAVYALGKAWHEEHLCCGACREPIIGNPIEYDNQIYCAADYAALVAPACRECSQTIQGETICALNATFHKECFVCKVCKIPFPDKSFYVLGDDPLCRFHYHEENNSLCGTCDNPIEGPCAEVAELNKRYHPECWCCYVCRVPLTATYYSFNNKPYCEADIRTVYKQEKAKKRVTLMRNL